MQTTVQVIGLQRTALTEAEQKAVDPYGLFDLNDFQEAQARLN